MKKAEPGPQESGISWIGRVPAHWTVKCLKHIALFQTGWTPPTGDAASYVGTNLWANIGDLGERVITQTKNCISDGAVAKTGIPLTPKGSLLFSFKLSVGQVSIAAQPMYTNEAIASFLPQDGFHTPWAFYAFPEFIVRNAEINIYGAKLLNRQRINDAVLPVPPVAEQVAIASYLDVETARIDALIHEKEGLVALLRELRGNVVRERTAGMHIDTPRKKTGDVFVPTIPSTWKLIPVGRYSQIGNGSTPLKDNPEFWVGGTYPWLNSAVVNHDDVHVGSEFVTPFALQKCHLPIVPAGSVLIALTGQGKTRGQVAVLRIEATINQHLASIRVDPDMLDGEFVFWALTGQYQALRMVSDGQGGTKGALTCDELARFRIPLPSLEEQRVIAQDLYRETKSIDQLIAHVDLEMDLLRELRSTTITDAVLGRIDVRPVASNKKELEAA